MKLSVSMSNIIALLFLALILLACQTHLSPPVPSFKGYDGNPVLVPGEPGSWDDLYVINAFELEWQDTIYMFYTAYNKEGSRALGLATSTDGFHFTKYEGNPILEGDGSGYDAFGVAQAQVFRQDSTWVMYFNGREIAGFSSGPAIGRATAPSLRGSWKKSEEPVIRAGRRGEWDADFIYLGPVRKKEDGTYLMYYSAGEHLYPEGDFYIGLATSKEGTVWKKYNNPDTRDHPFADSDPVLVPDLRGDIALVCDMVNMKEGFGMYYNGSSLYACSQDGIHWEKYRGKPVYSLLNDPWYQKADNKSDFGIQGNKLLFHDHLCFMYYDYGHGENSAISVAVASLLADD